MCVFFFILHSVRSRDISLCRSQEISQHAEAEAKASARQLVAMQQRLATLKDAVAAAQRVAAAREAAAAAAIQRNAAETAAELQKQDVDKQISQSEQEAKVVSYGYYIFFLMLFKALLKILIIVTFYIFFSLPRSL